MKPIKLILLFVFLASTKLIAQSKYTADKEALGIANQLMENQKFEEALSIYLVLLKHDSLNADFNYKTGMCYWKSNKNKGLSIHYWEKALDCNDQCILQDDGAHLMALIYLGDAYRSVKKFDLAIAAYKKFKLCLSPYDSQLWTNEIDRRIAVCSEEKKEALTPVTFKSENKLHQFVVHLQIIILYYVLQIIY